MKRANEVLIHQLRTGKTPLAAHCLAKYKSLPAIKGFCMQGCNEKETVEHLLSCPYYAKERNEVCYSNNIVGLLNNDPDKVLKYLTKIGRLAAPEM